jgi:hypothetical protein
MILTILTLTHVAISLVAIFSGFVVMFGLLGGKHLDGWTTFFLAATVATSLTGFFFPFRGVTPAFITGVVSLVVLAVAIFALYARTLAGAWRKTYVFSAVFALYLNVFVLVVQAFLKIPALKRIAPTQNDPPFKLTQLVVLVAFVALGIASAIRFRITPVSPKLGANHDQDSATQRTQPNQTGLA